MYLVGSRKKRLIINYNSYEFNILEIFSKDVHCSSLYQYIPLKSFYSIQIFLAINDIEQKRQFKMFKK